MTIIPSKLSHFAIANRTNAILYSIIARRVSVANATKQSTLATYESLDNFLRYANLRLYLSIHFWVIDSLGFLMPRDLDGYFASLVNPTDCHENSLRSFSRNDSKTSSSLAEGDKGGGLKTRKNSSAKFGNNKSTHPLTPSAREGEQNAKISAMVGESAELPHTREREAVEFTLTMVGEFFTSLTLLTKESK